MSSSGLRRGRSRSRSTIGSVSAAPGCSTPRPGPSGSGREADRRMSAHRRSADASSSHESARGDRLRILVVSFRFPPYNSAGAVSIGKAAKYLVALGHEVRVITARDQQLPINLLVEVDPGNVVATWWFNPMRVAEPLAGGRERVSATGFSAGRRHDRLVYRIGRLYRTLMIPDREIGWAWPAVRAGRRL